MLKFALYFLFASFATAQIVLNPPTQPILRYRMCTYNKVDFAKCMHTVSVSTMDLNPLPLECIVLNDRENCIRSVRDGTTDMTVLTGHGYKAARNEGLRPVIFAREDDSSLSIAVAPRNITVVDLQEAPIFLRHTNHRSFHAALFLNLRRGHDICGFTKVNLGPHITIEDSATYQPNDDEILICPDRSAAKFEDYQRCNMEADLQRAVFVKSTVSDEQIQGLRQVFDNILIRYGSSSSASDRRPLFNFFDTFLGSDNVIFKNNTIAFDLQPTYRNGINEQVFNYLHCNNDQQTHDPRGLL